MISRPSADELASTPALPLKRRRCAALSPLRPWVEVMILDINDCDPNAVLQADVCVIGSGAAGITIAREFSGTQHSVIVLEAGGELFEAPSQDPYLSLVQGLPHGGIHKGRVRVLGGATTLWAGQALPLFHIDFEKRDWVPYSGWPIDRAFLDPFYRRAEEVMQIPHSSNDIASWPSPCQVDYSPDSLVGYYSQFTSTPNFAQKYRTALARQSNIRILLHANVTSLEADPNASVLREVRARSLQGRAISVRARFFVLCCGGIESARLLLISDSVEKQGVGNQHDVVGRYFQDHPGIAVPVRPMNRKQFSACYDSGRRSGIRYSIKIAATAALQRSKGILHMGGEVYYPSSEEHPIAAAKALLQIARDHRQVAKLPKAITRVARRPDKVLAALYRVYIQGKPASVGSTLPHVGFGGEQQPNPQSRVTLARDRDVLGLRRTVLDWRLTSLDAYSMRSFMEEVAAQWRRLGIASLDLSQVDISDRKGDKHGGLVDANHHIGTTRMGTDPTTSVVNADCQVHGYANLYIGSSSVFPTGGFSNPTLTVIALCLRIADRVKLELSSSSQSSLETSAVRK